MGVLDPTQLDPLKRYLFGVNGPSISTYDDLLKDLIASVNDAAAGIMNGRQFGNAAYTEFYNGNGTDELQLNQWPITSLDGVWVDQYRVFADGSALDLVNDVTFDAEAGILYFITGMWGWAYGQPSGLPMTAGLNRQVIKVAYHAGIAAPFDAQEAARFCVADMFTRSAQLAGGQSQNELITETIYGGRSEQYKSELDPMWGIPSKAVACFMRYRTPN
jgi:hypothetical protein